MCTRSFKEIIIGIWWFEEFVSEFRCACGIADVPGFCLGLSLTKCSSEGCFWRRDGEEGRKSQGSGSRRGWPCCRARAGVRWRLGCRHCEGGPSGLSLHPRARGRPLSPPVMWDVSQQNAKSPLGGCKNVKTMNILV